MYLFNFKLFSLKSFSDHYVYLFMTFSYCILSSQKLLLLNDLQGVEEGMETDVGTTIDFGEPIIIV